MDRHKYGSPSNDGIYGLDLMMKRDMDRLKTFQTFGAHLIGGIVLRTPNTVRRAKWAITIDYQAAVRLQDQRCIE